MAGVASAVVGTTPFSRAATVTVCEAAFFTGRTHLRCLKKKTKDFFYIIVIIVAGKNCKKKGNYDGPTLKTCPYPFVSLFHNKAGSTHITYIRIDITSPHGVRQKFEVHKPVLIY
jgi:hypothetical protein